MSSATIIATIIIITLIIAATRIILYTGAITVLVETATARLQGVLDLSTLTGEKKNVKSEPTAGVYLTKEKWLPALSALK